MKVILVDDDFKKKNIISSSKYVNKQNITYVRKNEECINVLLNSTEEKKQTIICCSDGTAEAGDCSSQRVRTVGIICHQQNWTLKCVCQKNSKVK